MQRKVHLAIVPLLAFLLMNVTLNAQGYRWRSLSQGGAGFVSAIITSKQQQDLMYCRTDVGGAYKWNAATASWSPLQDFLPADQQGFYGVESLAIDPQANNRLYLFVGIDYFNGGKSAIQRSEDYGQTFTTIDVTAQFKAHGNGAGRSNGERLLVDPNLGSTLYVGTRRNGLWKSTDYGTTWTRLAGLNVTTTNNGAGVSFVLIDPASGTPGTASQTIYVGVSRYEAAGAENFFKSTDGGLTFTPVAGTPTAFIPQRAVLTNNGDLIINYGNGAGPGGNTTLVPAEPMNNGGIYKYNLASGAWTNITPSGIAKAWGGITVDPNNPLRMMASTINNYQLQYGPTTGGAYGDRIYLTTNGGATWRDVVNPGFNLNNNGAGWINGQAIHWAGSVEFDPFNTSKVYVTSGNGVFSNSAIDAVGSTWKFEVKGLEETVPTAIVSLPGGPLYVTVGDYDGFKYTDVAAYGTRITPTMGTTTGLAYAGLNTNFLLRVGTSRMYYSTDQGATWVQTTGFAGAQGKVAVNANGTTLLHAPNGQNTIFYSNDNGATWTGALNGAGPALFGLGSAIPVADMVNPSRIYLYNPGSGNFSRSINAGASFSVVQAIGSNGSKLMRTIPGKEGHIWVAMYAPANNIGLRRTTDGGTTFTNVPGVTACSAVGYGKEAPGASYPTLFIWGTVGGVTGIFRSTDEGANWTRINTDATMFGGPGNAQAINGDMNAFGVVYMSTVGRGVIVGWDPAVAPLPVSLTSFSVREDAQAGKATAQLRWTTSAEQNTSHFNLLRSTDAVSWMPIASVPTKAMNGNSSTDLHYLYADDVAGLSGAVYYRLQMVDKNGQEKYSSVALLKLGSRAETLSMLLLSNPVSQRQPATLRLTAGSAQPVVVKLIGINGAVVLTKSLQLSEGTTNVSLPEAANLAPGTYVVQLVSARGGVKQLSTKLVVQ